MIVKTTRGVFDNVKSNYLAAIINPEKTSCNGTGSTNQGKIISIIKKAV